MSDFEGIVLTNTLVRDSDVIMNVLTNQGKVSVKARGVLKANSKNRSVTEIGCYSLFHTIDHMNQNVLLLKNAEKVKYFSKIDNDLIRRSIYNCMLEVMNKTEYEFNVALEFIELLNHCENPYCLYAYFLCDLIKKSGITLIVDACVKCGDISKLYGFSIHDGGFVCKECFDLSKHYHLSVNDLKNLRYCMHASLNDYDVLEKNTTVSFDLVRYLFEFLNHYGEFHIKSHMFLEKIQPLG